MVWRHGAAELRRWRTGVVVTMLIITGLAQWLVVPEMEKIRLTIGPATNAFRFWHAVSSVMFVANTVLGVTLVAAGPRFGANN